jgi:hypothetical protein
VPQEEGYDMMPTDAYTKAVAKIKDLINYGGPKPAPTGLLDKPKTGILEKK